MPTNDVNAASPPLTDPEPRAAVNMFNVNHDPEDLVRYRGNWVAWSSDGRKVLFASPDPYELCAMVDAAGLAPGTYVLGAIEVAW